MHQLFSERYNIVCVDCFVFPKVLKPSPPCSSSYHSKLSSRFARLLLHIKKTKRYISPRLHQHTTLNTCNSIYTMQYNLITCWECAEHGNLFHAQPARFNFPVALSTHRVNNSSRAELMLGMWQSAHVDAAYVAPHGGVQPNYSATFCHKSPNNRRGVNIAKWEGATACKCHRKQWVEAQQQLGARLQWLLKVWYLLVHLHSQQFQLHFHYLFPNVKNCCEKHYFPTLSSDPLTRASFRGEAGGAFAPRGF